MKAAIVRIALALFVFTFCMVVGISYLTAHHISSGLLILSVGLTNLPLAWLHWLQYKKEKDCLSVKACDLG